MCNSGVASNGGSERKSLMSEDRIERETLIAASLERVWSLVAEPGFWVADKATPAPHRGQGRRVDGGEKRRARRLPGARGEGRAADVPGVPLGQRVPRRRSARG